MWPELEPKERSAWSNIIILLGIAVYACQTAHTIYQPRAEHACTLSKQAKVNCELKLVDSRPSPIEANGMNGLKSTKGRADAMRGRRKKREPTNLIISPCRKQRWSGEHTKSQMSLSMHQLRPKVIASNDENGPHFVAHKPIRITLSSLETNVDSSHCRVSALIDGARPGARMFRCHSFTFNVAWQPFWPQKYWQPCWIHLPFDELMRNVAIWRIVTFWHILPSNLSCEPQIPITKIRPAARRRTTKGVILVGYAMHWVAWLCHNYMVLSEWMW